MVRDKERNERMVRDKERNERMVRDKEKNVTHGERRGERQEE